MLIDTVCTRLNNFFNPHFILLLFTKDFMKGQKTLTIYLNYAIEND